MSTIVNPESPPFEVHDLSYSYSDRVVALNHVDLTIHRGDKLAILGSNGSGKSTLLKILDGLYFPNHGSVQAFGHSLTEQALRDDRFNFQFRSRVGFVFQDSDAQLFMPNVWDEVAFAPLQLGLERAAVIARVEETLAALHIEKLRDRPPHQLSGGEKRKVALASVLSLSPEVWLFDEPSAGLDPRSVSWLIDFIASPANSAKTIVLATHDLAILESIATRACVLDEDHHLVADASPSTVLADQTLLLSANLIRPI